ncbi:hypothetical protein PILCRDRAFT_37213, partial [Piloderma croceum F 1598]
VQNYTADLKHTLWSLQSAGSLHPFPKSKWKRVLSGVAVNLNVVFSGFKPSKVVQTHGDWIITWNTTSTAILCVFPHRSFELQQYSKYILQFFRTLPYLHSKVINLDKAICCYTKEVKHIELSEVGHFQHLEARYLQEDG